MRMWIKSQNKRRLVHVKSIQINTSLQAKNPYIIVDCTDQRGHILGGYDSFEKCQLVLDLMEPYTSNNKVFDMPANEDVKL